jgi:hypothetical protein
MDVYLWWVLCVIMKRYLRRADPSSRGVLGWCVVVYDLENSRMFRPWPELGCSVTGRKNMYNVVDWIRLTPNTMYWLNEKQSAWPERVLSTALAVSYIWHRKTQQKARPSHSTVCGPPCRNAAHVAGCRHQQLTHALTSIYSLATLAL